MYVSKTHKFIYMPPQKTGSSSVSFLLEKKYDAEIFRDPVICKSSDPNQKIDDGYLRHWLHVPEIFEDYYIFATVRNPYRRFISLYAERLLWKKTTPHDFTTKAFHDYVNKKTYYEDSFCSLLKTKKDEDLCDINPPEGCVPFKINKIIKLENIEKINELPFIKEKTKIKKLRVSNSNSKYKLTKKIANKIKEYMKEDFKKFNYSEKVPPDLWLKQFI